MKVWMLTGMQPYEADTPMGVLMAHMNLPIPDIRNLYPDLPHAVQAVIEQGMAKDPTVRYQSAGALAAAFKEAIQDGSRTASPATSKPVSVMADAPTMDIVSEPTALSPDQPAPLTQTVRRRSYQR